MDGLKKNLQALLVALFLLDVVLAACAYLLPDVWFRVFHGVPYEDPQGFLRRCGGNWAAFALFQGLALFRWKKAPHWLVLVAGLRFSDILTDWSYLWFCSDVTSLGRILLFSASPANLACALYLMYAYGRLKNETANASCAS